MKIIKIALKSICWNLVLHKKNPISFAFAPSPRLGTIKTRSLNPNPLSASSEKDKFINNGPFSFVQPALSLVGFKEGKTTFYGPAVDVDPKDYPTQEEQEARREMAKKNMFNIGEDERYRRKEAGEIFQKISIVYAILSSVLDDGSMSGIATRFLVVIPLFLAVGYTKSAETGL